MHVETVSATCLRLIEQLGQLKFIDDFYLVGGTALSLQLGHRTSIDLDFFTPNTFEPTAVVGLADVGTSTFPRTVPNDILAYIDGVKVEFMYFAYPPQFPLVEWEGISMIDPKDIGLFKLLTLLGRNHRKDIIDLYYIHNQVISIGELFSEFIRKYPKGDVDLFRNIERLFDDQAIYKSVMPRMMIETDFDQAYHTVKNALINAVNQQLQLI